MAPPLKDSDAVFFKGFVQAEDPGAVGARLLWVHPDTGVIKMRNEQNTDWTTMGAPDVEELAKRDKPTPRR